MKRYYITFFVFIICTSIIFSQNRSPKYKPSSFGYWKEKMRNPNQNFNQLVTEFDNFWKGKEKVKGSGYKQFKRWELYWQSEVQGDGTLPKAGFISNEYYKYEQQYGVDAVIGDWEYVGYSSNPQPEAAGHGRLSSLAFHPSNPNIIYVGAPAGGLWKSTTGGDNWQVCGTDYLPTIGVSSIAIDPNNPDVIYIGTGDCDSRKTLGKGVYKTINGGVSWEPKNVLIDDLIVSKILISPTNTDHLVISTEEGIYFSFDAGEIWVKSPGIDGLVQDLVNKPGTMNILYACMEGRFFRSDNSGITWDETTSGIPNPGHRSAIGVTAADPNKVYMFSTLNFGPYLLYMSNNSGLSFAAKSVGFNSGQGSYNLDIAVDQNNEDIVYVGMVELYKTTNAGNSWDDVGSSPLHADQHALEWSPHNGYLYIANDGGIYKSVDNGSTYVDINEGLGIGMTHRLSTSQQDPDIVVCGQQDCGSFVSGGGAYHHVLGGDGMDCEIDPSNSNFIYFSDQHGPIHRKTNGVSSSGVFAIGGMYDNGNIVNGVDETGGWLMPFQLHEDDPSIMFGCWNNVWKSTNINSYNYNNVSWTKISNFNHNKVIEIFSKSPADDDIMWVGRAKPWSLHLTTIATSVAPLWVEIAMPYPGGISWIETHPTQPNTVYVCILDRIYMSIDLGASWDPIEGNLPEVGKDCIVYQEGSNGNLYVATKIGVYYHDGNMTGWDNWVKFKTGIPLNVPVFHLDINYGTSPPQLFAGTWGRGIWKTDLLDDYRPNLMITSGVCNVNSTNLDINFGFKNESNMVDASNFYNGCYLSTDNTIHQLDYLISEELIPYASPGVIMSGDCSLNVKYVEPVIPSGTYYIGVLTDSYNHISELDEGDNSFLFSQQVTLSTPLQPQNLTATDGTYGNKIVLDWDPPSGLVDTVWYRVFRNTYNNPNTATELSSGPWTQGTNFWDETAEDGLDYYYWVKAAYNYKGYRPSEFCPYNKGWQYLSPPTNVEATSGVYNDHIEITWDAPENGTHFKVWRNTSTNINTATPLTTNWATIEYKFDYDVESGTTYFYWVKAARSINGYKPSPNYSSYSSGYVALTNAPAVTATDGDYTDRIELTWNSVPGASYYMLSGSYENDPENSNPMTAWTTATSHTDGGAQRGVYRYYWVRAATTIAGGNATGYGPLDTGWRKLENVQSIEATDGTSTECISISWDNDIWADYYKVYRHHNYFYEYAIPITNWIDETSFNDSTALPAGDYVYWVLSAKDTLLTSDFANENEGWRKYSPPEVEAADGVYADHVKITWEPVLGSLGIYQVGRGPKFSNVPTEILESWTTSMDLEYDDYDVTQGEEYEYFVAAARNNYGFRPSEYGIDRGSADECANITEDPNTSYRSIDITGTTCTVGHRVINNGPHPTGDSFHVAYLLMELSSGTSMGMVHEREISALDVGGFYDITTTINLQSCPGGPIPLGTYQMDIIYNSWNEVCETDLNDNVFQWETPLVQYTNAMYSEYTIGGIDPDYENFSEAVDDLIDRGISGGVIFQVRPGTYNEQVSIPPIYGSSATNFIQFRMESGHVDTAEIYFAGPNDNYTVQFDGSSHIRFTKLKITSPGYSNYQDTYANVIGFKNDVHDIIIEDCYIESANDPLNTSANMAAIYCGNSTCNNISLDNNKIRYGSYAVYIAGPSSGDEEIFNITIENNDIGNFSYKGIVMENLKNAVIRQNSINYSNTSLSQCAGISLQNIEDGFTVINNKVFMESCEGDTYGISLYLCKGAAGDRGLVANNFIAINSGFEEPVYGLKSFGCSYFDVYYNSISLTGQTYQDTYCIYLGCSDDDNTYDNNVKNNIFFSDIGGYAVYYRDEAINRDYVTEMDFNDLYTTGLYLALYGNSSQVADLNTWKAQSGFDTHSVSGNPLFISQSDLHAESRSINDTAVSLAVVQVDIDGESRSPLSPDIGADEFMPPPLAYDIFVNDIITPETAYDLGNQEIVQIELYNVGANDVSNFSVSYRINGGDIITETVTENLASYDVLWFSFATTANLSDTGDYIINAKTLLPGDLNGANDTYIDTITNLLPYNCIPLYGLGCSGNSGIEDFHFSGLNHNGTGCSENGYGDFTNYNTYVYQGGSYQMDISLGYGEQYVSMWIDLDDDLIFEENEIFVEDLYCLNGNQTYSATVDIPNSALPGNHRMRVRCAWQNSPVHPCNYYQFGEAHDYSVDIFTGGMMWVMPTWYSADCPGTPVEITIEAEGGTEPHSYLWSTGETTETILVSPEATTGYKVFVTDGDGFIGTDSAHVDVNPAPTVIIGGTTWLCENENLQLNVDGTAYGYMPDYCTTGCDMPTGYCTSGASSSANAIIEEVKINTINNNTAGICATYSDFTNLSTNVEMDYGVDLEITIGTCGTENTKGAMIFVDWNRDGDFNDDFENATECWAEDSTYTHFTSLYVPYDAVKGNTRMRIVAVETMDTWMISPCGNYSYGETEDYTLNIVGTANNQVTSFDWTGPNGFTSSLQNPVINNVVAADSGYYYLDVTDGNNCTNTDSIFVYIQSDYIIDAGNDTSICENVYYVANATVDNFFPIQWTTSGTGQLINGDTKTPTYIPSSTDIDNGQVVLKITAYPMMQCADSIWSSLTLSIQKIPFAEIPAGEMLCGNQDYQVAGAVVYNATSFYWSTTGTGTFNDSTLLNPLFTPSLTDIENGYVEIAINLQGNLPCSESAFPIPLSIQKEPTVYAGENTTICSNGSLSLLSAYASDYDSIKWFSSGTGDFLDKYMENTEYFPSQADIATGTIDLQLVAFPMMPCSDSIVSTLILTIIEETYADAGGSEIICENGSLSLSGATASNYSSVFWETSGAGYFDDPNTLNPEYFPGVDETGMVMLTLNAYGTSPCGNVSSPFYLDIIAAPSAYAGENASIMSGENYFLSEATASDYIISEWTTNGTGSFDDAWSLNPIYYPGSGETGEIELTLTAYGNWPCDSVTSSMALSILGGYDLDVKVYLEGPFNGTDMDTELNSILPLSHPYGGSPWNYSGGETTTLIPDPDIVDWVLVELREAQDASLASSGTMIAQQAAFLRKNGQVVGVDGSSLLHFDEPFGENLYVVIWHRNHLGILSASGLNESGGIYSYDFSDAVTKAYNGSAGYKEIIIGSDIYGMVGGDADANGDINAADKTLWTNDAGTKGYKATDHNMDVQVDNQDKNDTWVENGSYSSQVPD